MLGTCNYLVKFPYPTTVYEYFFNPHSLWRGPSLSSAVAKSISSFDSVKLMEQGLQTYFTENPNKELQSQINSAFLRGESFYVTSIYNDIKAVAFNSMVYRVLNLISIGIQQQINNSSWSKNSKLVSTSLVAVMPYIFMHCYGWGGLELALTSLVRIFVAQQFSPKTANEIRRADLISSYPTFTWNNFLVNNAYNTLINLSFTILADYGLGPIFFANLRNQQDREFGGLQMCVLQYNKFTSVKLNMKLDNVMANPIILTEAAWMLGKIMVDSLVIFLHALNYVKDLSNPLPSFLPKSWLKKLGIKEAPLYPNIIEEIDEPENVQPVVSGNSENEKQDLTEDIREIPSAWEHSSSSSSSSIKNSRNEYPRENKRERKERESKGDQLTHSSPREPNLAMRRPIRLTNNLRLMPLSGPGITKLNVWSIVDPQLPDFSIFQKDIAASGKIGKDEKIKLLVNRGGIKGYEISSSESHDRAIGRLKRGPEAVIDLLNKYLLDDKASKVLQRMSEYGADNLAIIYFNVQCKHEEIHNSNIEMGKG